MPADSAPAPAPVPAARKSHGGLVSLLLDFGPLLVFFLAYKFGNVIIGTAAFMVAIAVAVLVSKWKLGRVSPMMWLSAILVLFFGSLTIYLNDQSFIQIKPTIIYAFFAVMLFGGLLRGRALLQYLLEAAYEGLSDEGWRKLSRNWAIFFAVMAITNEIMRATMSFDSWLAVKVWGMTIVSFLFAMANIPMLMRHGLNLDAKGRVETVGELEPPQG